MVYVAKVGDEDEAEDRGGAEGRFVQEVTAFAASAVAQVGKEFVVRDGDVCNWRLKS